MMKKEDAIKRLKVIETEVQELKKIINQDGNKKDKNIKMSEFLFDMINDSNLKITKNELVLYKDDYILLKQDLKNGYIWVNNNQIWSIFYDEFGLDYAQIQAFIKDWMETNLNWKGFTPIMVLWYM